jgi:hypothetical protein
VWIEEPMRPAAHRRLRKVEPSGALGPPAADAPRSLPDPLRFQVTVPPADTTLVTFDIEYRW